MSPLEYCGHLHACHCEPRAGTGTCPYRRAWQSQPFFSFPGSCLGMPVFRALPGLGGTGILPVIDRRVACPTRGFHLRL
jgi:hypothetical protein